MAVTRSSITLLLLATVVFGADAGAPADNPDLFSMDLVNLLDITIVSASLHRQEIGDAPANVNVISATEIRRFGYRTLAEALNSVPGMYVSSDRTYSYLGARGLSTPGDYGTRYLLMVNGHSIADPVYDLSGSLEQEFGIEMSLVKQIEIVHGPASALYGSNAVLCTINVVTKSPTEIESAQAETTVGSLGEKKEHLAIAGTWKQASGVLSGSVFNFSGEHSIYVPELQNSENSQGRMIDMDGQRGFHIFANVIWRGWTFTLMDAQRDKIQPVSWGVAVLNDRGTRVLDKHGLAEAMYTRSWGRSELEWRLSYDWYDYQAQYRYWLDGTEGSPIEDNREYDKSRWLGSRFVYRLKTGQRGTMTFGADTRIDVKNLQSSFDVSPEPADYTHIDKPDRRFGFFAQHEADLNKHWKAVIGARVDTSAYRRNSVSPRVALIWEPKPRTTVKLLYGRSFRNPNSYELFFELGDGWAANTNLKPEISDTFELAVERRFRTGWKAAIDVFSTRMRNTITLGANNAGTPQFQNERVEQLIGETAEVAGTPYSWLEVNASLTVQKADIIDTSRALPNSPREIAKLRASVPLFSRRYMVSAGAYWLGARDTLYGISVAGALKNDLTVTRTKLRGGVEVQFGIRNLLNKQSFDPAGLDAAVPAMPQTGRTVFVSVLWHKVD